MTHHVKPVPEGMHTVTPTLVVPNGAEALQFYATAFGAKERQRMPGPDGKSILHAEFEIGDSVIFLADESPMSKVKSPKALGGTSMSIHLFVPDADALFHRAVQAGAQPTMPPADMFWGDRYAQVLDPYGHFWGIATHKEDLTPGEIGVRQAKFFQQMAAQGPPP